MSHRGRRALAGVVLLTAALIACGGCLLAAPTRERTLDEWIRHDAVQVAPRSQQSVNLAVDKVVGSLDPSVRLLGFGEALHGGEDILTLRNEFFKRLVEAHGYSAIAIETGFDAAEPVDDCVKGAGTSYDALLDSNYGRAFGRLSANRELVEWRYNADPKHRVKLSFYGFDISVGPARIDNPGHVLGLALDYLARIDGTAASGHRHRIDSPMAQATGWAEAWTDSSQSPMPKPEGVGLRIATEDLITELRTRRPALVARSSEAYYLSALHHATLARQMLDFHVAVAKTAGEPVNGTGLRGVRDALMADNLEYIVARERSHGKVMVFAHHGHLQRGKSVWPCCGLKYGTDVYAWWPAGSQLNDRMGSAYAVIGSGLGSSDATNGLMRAESGSLEGRLSAPAGAVLFIPTHAGKALKANELASLTVRSGTTRTYLTQHCLRRA